MLDSESELGPVGRRPAARGEGRASASQVVTVRSAWTFPLARRSSPWIQITSRKSGSGWTRKSKSILSAEKDKPRHYDLGQRAPVSQTSQRFLTRFSVHRSLVSGSSLPAGSLSRGRPVDWRFHSARCSWCEVQAWWESRSSATYTSKAGSSGQPNHCGKWRSALTLPVETPTA